MTKNEMLSDVNKAIFMCEIAVLGGLKVDAETRLKYKNLNEMRAEIEQEISKEKLRLLNNA